MTGAPEVSENDSHVAIPTQSGELTTARIEEARRCVRHLGATVRMAATALEAAAEALADLVRCLAPEPPPDPLEKLLEGESPGPAERLFDECPNPGQCSPGKYTSFSVGGNTYLMCPDCNAQMLM